LILASIRFGWKWILVGCLSSGGLAFLMIVAALQLFSVESIELRPESLTHMFRGPLAPKPNEFAEDHRSIMTIHDDP
jgi:hypothetical protein